jgi:hypothetical protein
LPEVDVQKVAPSPPPTIGYPVAPLKFWLMSILTSSLYNVYWGYQNFRRLDTRSNTKLLAAVSAFFLPLTFNNLLKGLRKTAADAGLVTPVHHIIMSWAFFLLSMITNLSSRTRYPLAGIIFSLAATFVLYRAQKKINQVNAAIHPEVKPESKFSARDISAILLINGFFALRHSHILDSIFRH